MEKIADYLKQSLDEVKKKFWASPGARVQDSKTGLQYQIGTITPRFDRRKKACVFLTDDGQCSIHVVAPFGCSHFDTHMTGTEGQRRAVWGMTQILESDEYTKLRQTLPFAESYKPQGY
jgi:Fe-S-cluster containining protein